MNDLSPRPTPASDRSGDDLVLPFAVEALDCRGRVVRLGPAVDALLKRHDYPPPVLRLVGEAVALTALLGSSLKIEGRFQLQTKTDGAVSRLVVDLDAPDRLRAYAAFDAERVSAENGAAPADATAHGAALLGTGHLAFTVDQGPEIGRYQGIVALDGQGLEEAAHQYFRQSEQIPTRVRLSVGEVMTGGGGAMSGAWRAGGILVQFLPSSPERQRQADLHPGDAPEGAEPAPPGPPEDDAWVEARALVETVADDELTDPTLSAERLLVRLFHERGVRAFEPQALRDACRCSRERILDMLRSFPKEERRDMVADDGRILVTCEFCSTRYEVEPDEVETDEAEAGAAPAADGRA